MMVGFFTSIALLTAALSPLPVLAKEYWQYQNDDSFYSALKPLPADVDPFEAYKKVFFSTKNETLAWW